MLENKKSLRAKLKKFFLLVIIFAVLGVINLFFKSSKSDPSDSQKSADGVFVKKANADIYFNASCGSAGSSSFSSFGSGSAGTCGSCGGATCAGSCCG